MGNYDEAHLAPMKEFFEELKKSDSELAKEFPIKGREVLQIKAEILRKLADFFADNQLEETRDPSMYPPIYTAGAPY